jgi:hypothetical protein
MKSMLDSSRTRNQLDDPSFLLLEKGP